MAPCIVLTEAGHKVVSVDIEDERVLDLLKELTAAQKGVMVFFLAAILCGSGMRLYYSSDAHGRSLLRDNGLVAVKGAEKRLLTVDVDGAVRRPGVYRLAEGATRMDAAREAGGLANADTQGVNLAGKVADGEKIYFPARGELRGELVAESAEEADAEAAIDTEGAGAAAVDEGGAGGAVSPDASGRAVQDAGEVPKAPRAARPDKKKPKVVNLNTATAADLETLPGVGPSTAKKIIDLRKLRGPFKTVEEVMLVKGIGIKKFEKMKIYLRVK